MSRFKQLAVVREAQPWTEELDRDLYLNQIHAAIEQRHLRPAYQPIVDLRTGALASFEVLSRWTDPIVGEISPAEFIPVLERLHLMDEFLEMQLQRACSEAVEWAGEFSLSFNIAPSQLAQPNLAGRIAAAIASTGFALDRITVEITECSLFSDFERAGSNLRALEAQGVKVAIDDFGVGHSSLARLEAFPFRQLKIDRCFVHELQSSPSKRRITAAIIGLGQSLGITVVAEGVESHAEETVLRRLGCELGQGWLYGPALAAGDASNVVQLRPPCCKSRPSLDDSPFQQLFQLRTLYAQAPVGLALLDRKYCHVRANDQFAAMHGMSASNLEGLSVHEVMHGQTLATVLRVLRESLGTDAPIVQQHRLSGREILVFCSRVKDVCDEVIGFSVVAIDITERDAAVRQLELSEEHFRRATELHLEIVWAAEPDGTLSYIGPTAADVAGETMQQRIERWVARMHPADYAHTHEKWLQWVPSGQPFESEFRIRGADEHYRWMRSRARPHRSAEGRILRWYGIITDIHDLWMLQEQLRGSAGSGPDSPAEEPV